MAVDLYHNTPFYIFFQSSEHLNFVSLVFITVRFDFLFISLFCQALVSLQKARIFIGFHITSMWLFRQKYATSLKLVSFAVDRHGWLNFFYFLFLTASSGLRSIL